VFLTYMTRELRGRARQAVIAVLGLAVGAGLLITSSAASDGATNAYAAVLHTLSHQHDQASAATGSLRLYLNMTRRLGTVTSIAVLIAASGQTAVFTVTAVSRRVPEFGTLKALGWRGSRIAGQVMAESAVTGVIGGAAGAVLGYAGAALIDLAAPRLSAPAGSRIVSAAVSAPVTIGVLMLAVAISVAGGILAGALGGWRAARLPPLPRWPVQIKQIGREAVHATCDVPASVGRAPSCECWRPCYVHDPRGSAEPARRCCTGSAACASAGRSATTSTRPS
jgi:FtsX-like permease family